MMHHRKMIVSWYNSTTGLNSTRFAGHAQVNFDFGLSSLSESEFTEF
jgi:hypothetical protein